MMGKELLLALLLGISFSSAFGRYVSRRQVRAESPWKANDSWPSSADLSDEYSEERRSIPSGFSAVRGKRVRNPQNAALVSALMKLAKLRSQETLKADYLQDNIDNDDGQFGQFSTYYGLPNEFDSSNYPGYDRKRSSAKNYIPTDRREFPQGFFIARGKKQSDTLSDEEDPFRFFSARGKKNHNDMNLKYDPSSFDSLSRRALPEGFYLSRGKRDLEVPTYGAGDQHLPVMRPHAA